MKYFFRFCSATPWFAVITGLVMISTLMAYGVIQFLKYLI